MLDSTDREIDAGNRFAMRRLMLLRHTKSDWTETDRNDLDRPLTPRGREAAPLIGAYMAHHALLPDLVICSPAARARETFDLVAPALPDKPRLVTERRIYDVGADTVLGVVKEIGRDVHSLLVVGHNPSLQDLAELLIASGDVDLRQRLLEKFPTGGLAVIDFPVDDWKKLHPKAGRLDRFVTPRTLEMATD